MKVERNRGFTSTFESLWFTQYMTKQNFGDGETPAEYRDATRRGCLISS